MNDIGRFWQDGYVSPAGSVDISAVLHEFDNQKKKETEKARESSTSFGRFPYFSKDMNPHLRSQEVIRLVNEAKITNSVKEILGDDIVCINTIFIAKSPQSGDYLAPHQDSTYWGLKTNQAVSVWIAITDSHVGNGCMSVLPGSHLQTKKHRSKDDPKNILQMGESCEHEINQSEMIPLELMAGEYSIHHCQVVHMSSCNQSKSWRVGLVLRYAHRDALDEEYLDKHIYTDLIQLAGMEGGNGCKATLPLEKDRLLFNRRYFRKLNDSALKYDSQ